MEFEELELIQPILRAVREEGYFEPSPIQRKAIPPALDGRDLLGCAQTGTGKTAAFAIPILQRLTLAGPQGRQRPIRALVLTPTRELALQVAENFRAYGRYLRLRTEVIFGGVSQNPQVDALQRGVDILVATPGRLNDLIGQGYVQLNRYGVYPGCGAHHPKTAVRTPNPLFLGNHAGQHSQIVRKNPHQSCPGGSHTSFIGG